MSLRYTEGVFQGRVVSWMNKIIEDENLPFEGVDQEIEIEGRRFPDVVVWEKRKVKAALLLELKQPIYDAWALADEALTKAYKATIPYFATWNVNRFFSWETYKRGDLFDNLWYPKEVASIRSIEEVDRIEDTIKSFLGEFLRTFAGVYYGTITKPPLEVDERFIYRLRSAIDSISIPTFHYVRQLWSQDEHFRDNLRRWFAEQGWTFTGSDDDFEKVARQYVYLLIDKVIFYSLLRTTYRDLPKVAIPAGLDGKQFREILQVYFDRAIEKDFRTIYSANFLDSLPPPRETIDQLRTFTEKMGEYDFSKVEFEVLGRVFERLIPDAERHKLGQYYTRPDVVDLILGFCVRKADDFVIDPACGAGTFLVRAYYRKRYLDSTRLHSKLIRELCGYDVAKFPAHLSTINLFSRDLSKAADHPRIERKDFFDISAYQPLGVRRFDAVVMNPPYTRQEEMEDLVAEEKNKAHSRCLQDWATMRPDKYEKKRLPDLNRRASIYTYFFIHGGAFLDEGRRLGLVTSNSWLDVDYGFDLQRFFLENFRILAVMQSKVERWFVDADINTCIAILERCSDHERRSENQVKFVQLRKPLSDFIPPIPLTKTNEERRTAEEQRWGSVEALIRRIYTTQGYFEDDSLKISSKLQAELRGEGYDSKRGEYTGFRWSKYIDAPKIFFEILRRGQNILVPLAKVADIGWGSLKTGADEFFYLAPEVVEKWSIEPRFLTYRSEDGKELPNYVIKSPKESDSIIIDASRLKFKVLTVPEDKGDLARTNVLKYIAYGEEKGYHERPTCRSRRPWYDLGPRKVARILWPGGFWKRFVVYYNEPKVLADRRLFNVYVDEHHAKTLCAILNSTLVALFNEIHGKTVFGQGLLLCDTYAVEQIPILDPEKLPRETTRRLLVAFQELARRPIGDIFEEVKRRDRQELDNIVFDSLGLTQDERKQVYAAVVDLVENRVRRAGSVERRSKKVGEIDVHSLMQSVVREIEGGKLKKFPDEFVGDVPHYWIIMPEGDIEVGSDLNGYYVKVGDKTIRSRSQNLVKYVRYAFMNGVRNIRIPKEERMVEKAVDEYSSTLRAARKAINEFLESSVPDRRLRQKVKDEVWKRLL